MSHDWPQGIAQFGDVENLLRRKPYFRSEVQSDTLGSPPAMQLLKKIQPQWWFSAHLHCRFEATVPHIVPIGDFLCPFDQLTKLTYCERTR